MKTTLSEPRGVAAESSPKGSPTGRVLPPENIPFHQFPVTVSSVPNGAAQLTASVRDRARLYATQLMDDRLVVKVEGTLAGRIVHPAGRPMPEFFVTYGCNSTLAGCYSSFHARDMTEARQLVFKHTGGKHAFLYAERDWLVDGQTQAEEYNLKLVPLQPQRRITSYNIGLL